MQRPFPSDFDDVGTWISEALDDGMPRVIGRGWRHKLLGGRSVHQAVNESTGRKPTVQAALPVPEAMVVSHHVLTSGMKRADWIRRCVGAWLVEHDGVDPERIPSLTEHLDVGP